MLYLHTPEELTSTVEHCIVTTLRSVHCALTNLRGQAQRERRSHSRLSGLLRDVIADPVDSGLLSRAISSAESAATAGGPGHDENAQFCAFVRQLKGEITRYETTQGTAAVAQLLHAHAHDVTVGEAAWGRLAHVLNSLPKLTQMRLNALVDKGKSVAAAIVQRADRRQHSAGAAADGRAARGSRLSFDKWVAIITFSCISVLLEPARNAYAHPAAHVSHQNGMELLVATVAHIAEDEKSAARTGYSYHAEAVHWCCTIIMTADVTGRDTHAQAQVQDQGPRTERAGAARGRSRGRGRRRQRKKHGPSK